MPKGKKKDAYIRALAAAILAALCLLTACQPTPETPPVVNKADGKMEAKMSESPAVAPVPYAAPAHWKESVQQGMLEINIDADIKLPGVSKYPVVKVEPVVFSQQRVDELVNYFAAGKKLYRWPAVMTKADYEKELIEAKKGQEVDGKFVVTEDSKAWVKELEEKVRNAPEKYEREYVDTKLTYARDQDGKEDKQSGENFLSVAVDNGKSAPETFDICNYVKNSAEKYAECTIFSYSRSHGGTSESILELNRQDLDEYPDDPNTKKLKEWIKACDKYLAAIDSAKKEPYLAEAKKLMDDLQIKDLVPVSTEKYVFEDKSGPYAGGYMFSFVRQSGGIPGFETKGWGYNKEEEPPQYAQPFMQELVHATVSEAGVEWLSWMGCAKVVETVSENVGLLPFDQVRERVKKQLFYKNSFGLDSYGMEKKMLNVTSAELRTGYINVKDHLDQALLVPMWVVHATETYTIQGRTDKGNEDDYLFNAIDGGVAEAGLRDRP
jgi:N-acetylmuramoyl-L-alanine amidase CwlA